MRVKCINKESFDATDGTVYDVYGKMENTSGTFYLVLSEKRTPKWISQNLFEIVNSEVPNGWLKKDEGDTQDNRTTVCSFGVYFGSEEDIMSGTIRGRLLFEQMSTYLSEGYGLSAQTIARFTNKIDTNKSNYNKKLEKDIMMLPDEDDITYLVRVISTEVISISMSLPEVMQWRIGSALQGDAYELTSSVAAAQSSIDEYIKQSELENTRTKVYVLKSALRILPGEKLNDGLAKKLDQLLDAIDVDIQKANTAIEAIENEWTETA